MRAPRHVAVDHKYRLKGRSLPRIDPVTVRKIENTRKTRKFSPADILPGKLKDRPEVRLSEAGQPEIRQVCIELVPAPDHAHVTDPVIALHDTDLCPRRKDILPAEDLTGPLNEPSDALPLHAPGRINRDEKFCQVGIIAAFKGLNEPDRTLK